MYSGELIFTLHTFHFSQFAWYKGPCKLQTTTDRRLTVIYYRLPPLYYNQPLPTTILPRLTTNRSSSPTFDHYSIHGCLDCDLGS